LHKEDDYAVLLKCKLPCIFFPAPTSLPVATVEEKRCERAKGEEEEKEKERGKLVLFLAIPTDYGLNPNAD
jgi:hypothetical protein